MVDGLALLIFGAFANSAVGRKKLLRREQGFTETIWAQSREASETWLLITFAE